jgi:hypothetical protein
MRPVAWHLAHFTTRTEGFAMTRFRSPDRDGIAALNRAALDHVGTRAADEALASSD